MLGAATLFTPGKPGGTLVCTMGHECCELCETYESQRRPDGVQEKVVSLPCGHSFGDACLQAHFSSGTTNCDETDNRRCPKESCKREMWFSECKHTVRPHKYTSVVPTPPPLPAEEMPGLCKDCDDTFVADPLVQRLNELQDKYLQLRLLEGRQTRTRGQRDRDVVDLIQGSKAIRECKAEIMKRYHGEKKEDEGNEEIRIKEARW